MESGYRMVTKIGLCSAAGLILFACTPERSAVVPTSAAAATIEVGVTTTVSAPTVDPAPEATTTSAQTVPGATTTTASLAQPDALTVEVILIDLENPRGVGIDAQGGLLIAEAGYGEDAEDLILRTGRLTRFLDRNGDGDFDDPGEAERWLDNLYSFNSANKYETGRDEVSGATDVLVHEDGRVFVSLDGGIDDTGGDFILFEMDEGGSVLREIAQNSNMTGIDFGPYGLSVYATQSTLNSLIEIDLEDGNPRPIVTFDDLLSGQQAVPAGLALDPVTGDVLVALFSGVAKAVGVACRFVPESFCDGRYLPLVPTDAKVVRVDPETGAVVDEVTGLTAAVDVAVDEEGNVFVVEMAADYGQLFPARRRPIPGRPARPPRRIHQVLRQGDHASGQRLGTPCPGGRP